MSGGLPWVVAASHIPHYSGKLTSFLLTTSPIDTPGKQQLSLVKTGDEAGLPGGVSRNYHPS